MTTTTATEKSIVQNTEAFLSLISPSSPPKKKIGLYFSASWCNPCRRFTPFLSDFYKNQGGTKQVNGLKESEQFDIVFISLDHTEEKFEEYASKMPWNSISWNLLKSGLKADLCEKYEIKSLPALVILDSKTGNVVNSNGVDTFNQYIYDFGELEDFSWTPNSNSTQ
jgi:nucleoredoxin